MRFIDGFLTLPTALEKSVRIEIEPLEKEKNMALVTSWERIAKKEGREEGGLLMARQNIIDVLEVRFGSVPPSTRDRVNAVSSTSQCRKLLRKALQVESIESFDTVLGELG